MIGTTSNSILMEWLYTLFCRQRSKHRSFLWALHPRQPQYQEGFQPADRTLHGIYRHSLCCHTCSNWICLSKKKPTNLWCKRKKNFRNTRASRCGMGFHIIRFVKYVKIVKATSTYFLVRRASEQLNNKSIFFIYFFILFLIYKLRLFTMRKIERK